MNGVNKHIIVGVLGKDPELKFTPNGNAVCKFSVATSEKWNDRNGQKQERTEWHNVVIFGKLAETANQYLSKGSKVYLEGKVTHRSWDKPDGSKGYATETAVSSMVFLGGGQQQGGQQDNYSQDAGGDW